MRQVDPGNIVHASDTNGLVVITQLQPIAVVFTIPEDSLPPVMDKLQAGEKLAVDAYDRADKTKLATGYLLTVDNQIDSATGTVKLKAQFANDVYQPVPESVRQRAHAARGEAQRHDRPYRRHPARHARHVRLRGQGRQHRHRARGQAWPDQGELAAVDSGLTAGEQVVVDGSDKLREGAKVELAGKDGAAAPTEGSHPKHGGKRRRDGDAAAPATTN